MNTLVIITFILIFYWKFKNQYSNRLTIEFQYKLFDLRDKLRDLAVAGKINKENWQFRYLDGSISKTVNELDYINLYTAIFVGNKYRKDRNFIMHKSLISKGVEENKYTSFFYEEYGALIVHYVIKKHFILRIAMFLHIFSSIISRSVKNRMKKSIGNFRIAPETSEAYDIPEISRQYGAFC